MCRFNRWQASTVTAGSQPQILKLFQHYGLLNNDFQGYHFSVNLQKCRGIQKLVREKSGNLCSQENWL